MYRGKRIIAFLIAMLLLITTAGCGSDKELWEVLEDAQYNSYKPRLDYMVKKYGDMFEMDVYGEVYCTDPEYKDWHIGISGNGGADDFAIRLRRDDLEEYMQEIAEPIFGRCKVYIHGGYPNTLEVDADIEDFFTYNDQWGLMDYRIYVPYSEDYQIQGEALVAALKSRNYTLSGLNILFFEEEVYEQACRGGKLPEGYRFRLKSGHYDEWRFKWIENTGLTYMAEKYGDMFKMELDGTIICTDPEYQDWNIVIKNNTDDQYPDTDNFAIRLHRDELELIMQEIAEPILGECKIYVNGGLVSELGADTEAEGFLTYKTTQWPYGNLELPHDLVCYCICVPYREDYRVCGEALMPEILDRGYLVSNVYILFLDQDQYEQIDQAQANQLTKRDVREGYKARLLTKCNGPFDIKIETYWDEIEPHM